MEYLYLLFLKCFKGLNTSGWNTLAEILMPLLMFQESSSGKVTLNVLTDNLQIAVCGKLCGRLLNQFLLMRYPLWPHTLCVCYWLSRGVMVFWEKNVWACFPQGYLSGWVLKLTWEIAEFSILTVSHPISSQYTQDSSYITWERNIMLGVSSHYKRWRFIVVKGQF